MLGSQEETVCLWGGDKGRSEGKGGRKRGEQEWEVEEREREVGEVRKEHKGREKRSTSEVRRVRVRGGE